jgi:MscS family membrane protein
MLDKRIIAVVAAAFLGFSAARSSQAQLIPPTDSSNGATAAKQAESDPELQEILASPRATMTKFLDLMDDGDRTSAAECLDLSALNRETRAAKGPIYAYELKETLDRMARINPDLFSDDPDHDGDFIVGSTLQSELEGKDLRDANRIVLSRGPDDLWRFNQQTVAELEAGLYDRWRNRDVVEGVEKGGAPPPFEVWLKDRFPSQFHQTILLLPNYQWICLVVLVFLGFLADLVVRFTFHYLCQAWFRFIKSSEQFKQERKVWRPVGLLAQALVWYVGTKMIGLPIWALAILLAGLKFFTVVAAVWTSFLLIDLLSRYVAAKASKTRTKFDDLLVPLISKSLKAVAVVMGVLTSAEAFDLPITGLLTSLGLVGAALALASKDAVSNFFGSVTVLVDRPFEIGDWVVTNNVEGTVETVGFRSTRIRTFYNSQVTVPNSLLTTAIVDNMGRRRYRRIKTTLGLQYDTRPEQVDAFCEGVREIIRRHPYTRKDYYHVYLNEFDASSINVLLYCFVETPDWAVELREKHRLYVDIMKLAESLGVQFAFPTRTLHLFNEEPPGEGQPVDLSVPAEAGREQAARITGPPLTGARRPGGVDFPGPTPVESDEADASAGDEGGPGQ